MQNTMSLLMFSSILSKRHLSCNRHIKNRKLECSIIRLNNDIIDSVWSTLKNRLSLISIHLVIYISNDLFLQLIIIIIKITSVKACLFQKNNAVLFQVVFDLLLANVVDFEFLKLLLVKKWYIDSHRFLLFKWFIGRLEIWIRILMGSRIQMFYQKSNRIEVLIN